MSIIEKAAKKLFSDSPAPPPPAVEREPILERAGSRAAEPRTTEPRATGAEAPSAPRPDSGTGRSEVQRVNLGRLKQMGAITPDDERSHIAEEFRLIKRPLLANAFGGQGVEKVRNGHLIMVTSCMPGEGKTFCSINLAISIAMELDRTVLLVDADVARPRLPEYLGLRADRGLLDVLRDKNLTLPDVLIRTDLEKLTVLPAGQGYRRATELLASAAMTDLVEEMASRYPDRAIIFDSPPLLATSESGVLASHMGQIVMVVEAERTPQEAVREALTRIEGCDVVGFVLNKAAPASGSDYYYYGYGGYGYGGNAK